MILFFGSPKLKIFAVEISEILLTEDLKKLSWVLDSRIIDRKQISEKFIGPNGIQIIRKIFGVILLAISVKLFAQNIKMLFV